MSDIPDFSRAAGEREFVCEYEYNGASWGLTGIYASSAEEAQEKLLAVGRSGRVLGALVRKESLEINLHVVAFSVALGLAIGVVGAGLAWGVL